MTILRNIVAIVLGIVVGSVVNMTIVSTVSPLFPLPEGTDPSNLESIKANFHKFTVGNFVAPFLAHALGTLVGAFLAAAIAKSYKLPIALSIGFVFLLGGIAMVVMLGGPLWFAVIDLGLAYIPMGWLGYAIVKMLLKSPPQGSLSTMPNNPS
jgi:putative effector of murein hydrolase